MLRVDNLVIRYGPIEAVKGISFEVRQGEIVSLLGPNGAGKTSTLSALMGLTAARSGTVELDGEMISGQGTAQICSAGHDPVSRREARVSQAQRGEEPSLRRDNAEGLAQSGCPGADVRAFSNPGRTAKPACGHFVWWRAADACHRPRADGVAENAPA